MKIMAGVAPNNHVLLAMDEVAGLEKLGYTTRVVSYGRNEPYASKINKLVVAIAKAFAIVYQLYKFRPHILYLNSRLEKAASFRDFISLLIIKVFYVGKLRKVVKTHGSDMTVIEDKSFFTQKIVLRFLIKNVDRWLFLSSDEKSEIESYSAEFAGKIFLIPNIIDASRCSDSAIMFEKYNIPLNKFKVLFAGRMIKEKGCFDVMKSIPLLKFRNQCIFLFMGSGDDLKELKALAEQLDIMDCVKFMGFIPEVESDPIYSGVDLLAFPTYFSEGFPMVLFKSVAMGLPIITTKIRAAKDFLSSPQNVLWVNKQSPAMVAAAIQKIYDDVTLRDEMSSNNKMVGKLFSRDKVCKQIKTVFDTLN